MMKEADKAATLARPSAAQYAWQDMELGMFFHWFPDNAWNCGEPFDIEQQKKNAATLSCPDFDPAQWVQSAKDLGAKYIVFVAKHGYGLCRWRSEYGGFNFKYSKYPIDDIRADPLRSLADECRKNDIKLGIYLNASCDIFNIGDGGIARDPARQAEYTELYRGWLKEVLTQYGDMVEIWFDGSMMLEAGDILRQYAPNIIIFQSKYANIRWVGQEEGYASDPAWNTVSHLDGVTGVSIQRHGDPDGDCWMPLECDARLRRDWGYNDDPANKLNSLDKLMDMYYNSVGHGANLLINHAPASTGRIRDDDMARMKEFGDEIRRRFGHPVAVGEGEGEIVELDLGGVKTIDHVITMEELSGGERIRAYSIEGLDPETNEWVRLTGGIAVGHKKIDFFNARALSKIRIHVLKSVGTPLIRSISAHYAGVTPKIPEPVAYGEVCVREYGTEMYEIGNNWDAELSISLDAFTKDAGQYRVSFRDSGDQAVDIDRAWVVMDGVRYDSYVERVGDTSEFNLFVGGPKAQIDFHVHIRPRRDWKLVKGEVYYYRMT